MSKEIWNLGRVVGFSNYELYLRHVAIESPTTPPATEKEWLCSTLTMGNSMLLRIGTDNVSGVHYRDIPLPADSKICAANTIFASYFAGSGYIGSASSDYTGFATRVTDYGPLIENTSSSHPSGSTVPPTSTATGDLTPEMKAQIPEYLKIIDGIVIQPGTWPTSEAQPPYCDFQPTMADIPNIRISFKDRIEHPFFILLTGFSNKFVVQGVSGTDTATASGSPDDGDFLGPWVFPWAAKIIFSIPPAFTEYISPPTAVVTATYTRKLPTDASAVSVTDSPIIDFKSYDPAEYYNSYGFLDSVIDINISQLSTPGTGGSILTAYAVSDGLPYALFGGSFIDGSTGEKTLGPVDTVAPGTVKLYTGNGGNSLADLVEEDIPYNTGFFRDDSFVIYEINSAVQEDSDRYLPVSDDVTEDIASLYVYNTRYLWLFRNSHVLGAAGPSQEELSDTKEINNIVGMTGYVSDKFITDFCVSYDDAIAATEEGRICDLMYMQRSYLRQIATKYDFVNNPAAKDYFKFFFYSPFMSLSGVGQQGMFLPVDVRTNRICIGIDGTRNMNASHGFNFSTSSITVEGVTIPPANTDIMGAYWDIASSPTATTCSQQTDTAGVYVFQNHPVLHNVVKDFEAFWKPYTGTPKSPAGFNDQFVQWFSSIMVTDVVSTTILTAMGIHSDYHNIDFQSFMQYAATGRDMSQPISSVTTSSAPVTKRWYLFSAADIQTIKQMTPIAYPPNDWGTTYYASAVMKANMSTFDFYKMAELHILELNNSGGIITEGIDVTNTYRNSSYHQWVASGRSGVHETKALSLVDNSGALLSTSGASGSISTEVLNWNVLLEALSQNKTIDVLGDGLRGMKSSGDNYIQLGNSMRLYLSSTEPTGTIPEGSLGIGWGGIKIYTSGAWGAYT